MATIIYLLVVLILLGIAWKAWKTTMRDCIRDELFDLRDEWRTRWLKEGLDMTDPAYAAVRGYINAALRYTTRFRLVELIYYSRQPRLLEVAPDIAYAGTGREVIDRFADSIRHRVLRQIQFYMLMTSLMLFPVLVLTVANVLRMQSRRPLAMAKKTAGAFFDRSLRIRPEAIETAIMAA